VLPFLFMDFPCFQRTISRHCVHTMIEAFKHTQPGMSEKNHCVIEAESLNDDCWACPTWGDNTFD
jgi:hypothetical protein